MQQRLARAGRRAFQAGPRLLLATIGRHGVVDIVPGAEHGFLECQRCLLGLRLAQPQPAAQLAALEEGNLQRRAHAEDAGAVGVQLAQLQRLQADVARQGDARIEIALGHADRGHRGMQAGLSLADVGTPLGQLAGQAHRHPHRTAGMGASVSSRACSVRRLVQQQRQGVHQLVHAHRQRRHGRPMAAAWASAWDTSSSVATPSRCRSRVSARLRLALSSVWRSTASWFWAPRSRM